MNVSIGFCSSPRLLSPSNVIDGCFVNGSDRAAAFQSDAQKLNESSDVGSSTLHDHIWHTHVMSCTTHIDGASVKVFGFISTPAALADTHSGTAHAVGAEKDRQTGREVKTWQRMCDLYVSFLNTLA